MSAPTNRYCGFILDRCVDREKFWRIVILTQEFGAVTCLLRISTKSKTNIVPDLFDEAEILLEKPKAQNTSDLRFAKEYCLVCRNSGIAKSYASLSVASKFASILAKNAFAPDTTEDIFTLCKTTFIALIKKPNPEACYLKALWTLSRHCGYPVKEDWLENSNSDDRRNIVDILRTPLESVSANVHDVERYIRHLEFWLEHEHQFIVA